MALLILIFGLIAFVGLVVLHELGHAIVARRNGVEVEEFGIGFPPRIWGKKLKNGTFFSLNWLPLGGFVKLKGEHDAADGPGTYGGASLWAKSKILLAGVAVNWLTAVAIFTILALTGMPQLIDNQFTVASDTKIAKQDAIAGVVVKGSPATKADIRVNDRILQLADQKVTSDQKMIELTAANAGKTVPIVFDRQGSIHTENITLNKERTKDQGFAGVVPVSEVLTRSTWSAPIVGVGVTAQFTYVTVQGLAKTVAHLAHQHYQQAGQNIAGPVGIFTILQRSSELGLTSVMFLIGIISLTLAVMNVLPIPALDGGRLFVTIIFRLLKRKLTEKREEAIQMAGFAALMLLVILTTVVDVGRLIGK